MTAEAMWKIRSVEIGQMSVHARVFGITKNRALIRLALQVEKPQADFGVNKKKNLGPKSVLPDHIEKTLVAYFFRDVDFFRDSLDKM